MNKNRKQLKDMRALNDIIKHYDLSDVEVSGILDNVPKYRNRISSRSLRKIKKLVSTLSSRKI